MAEAVVDDLEAIEIKKHQREDSVHAPRSLHRFLKTIDQQRTIGKTGELVEQRGPGELLLHLLQIRNIRKRTGHAARMTVGGADRVSAKPEPEPVARARTEPAGDVEGARGFQMNLQGVERAGRVFRVQPLRQCGESLGQVRIVGGVAEQFQKPLGKITLARLDVPIPNAVVGTAHGQFELFLGLGQFDGAGMHALLQILVVRCISVSFSLCAVMS